MKQATVGFRTHSGWAAMVAVSVEKGAPHVLARERVHLVETFTYRFRQPYHTAAKLPIDENTYRWASLSQIKAMMLLDNVVGPYVRTVLAPL